MHALLHECGPRRARPATNTCIRTTQLASSNELHAAHLHTMMVLFLGAFPHKRSGRGGYGLPLTVPATRGDELPFLLQPGSGGYGHPL